MNDGVWCLSWEDHTIHKTPTKKKEKTAFLIAKVNDAVHLLKQDDPRAVSLSGTCWGHLLKKWEASDPVLNFSTSFYTPRQGKKR